MDRDSIEALIDEYEDYVTVTTTYEGTDTFVEFDVKYPAYAEIVNEDGEFKVQGALIAVTEDGHIISVVDGSTSKMATAKSTMSDDTANGVFIRDINDIDEPGTTPAGASGPCCDFVIGEQETIGSRRQYNGVFFLDWSIVFRTPDTDPYVNTAVLFVYHSEVKTRKKKKFLGITYWTCKRTKLEFERTFEIYHNIPNTTNPWTGDVDLTTGKECTYDYLDGLLGPIVTHHPWVYPVYEVCVDQVYVSAEDTNVPGLNAIIDCD